MSRGVNARRENKKRLSRVAAVMSILYRNPFQLFFTAAAAAITQLNITQDPTLLPYVCIIKSGCCAGELFWNAQSLFTTSVPDGKVSAPSARAINSETPLFERQGRQNGGGLKRPLKINMVSNSERRCWDGNICGLCTRRGHSSADRIVQSVGDERNWVGKLAVKQRRTRRHFEYSNKHFDLFFFQPKRRFRFCSPLRRLSSHCDVVHFYGRTLTTRRLTSPSMLIASITVELSFSNKPTSTSSS